MKHSRWRRGAGSVRILLAALSLAAVLAVSCGGPYTPKRINVAGDKIALADQYFAKGTYNRAAVEYKDFLATFAGDERSDYAQFRLAESYRMDKEYALAQVEYQIVMTEHAYSEYVDDASYLDALCAFKQAPRAERDQAKTYEAQDRLNRFLTTFPASPRVPEARATLKQIHERLGEKDFLSAQLYFKRRSFDAALIYLNKVIDLDPETVWAGRSLYYKGRVEEQRSDPVGAARDYRAAITFAATFPEKQDAARRLKLVEQEAGGAAKPDGR